MIINDDEMIVVMMSMVFNMTFKNSIFLYIQYAFPDPPRPIVDKRVKNSLANHDANLTCQATGTRISSVQWYKWARRLSLQHQSVRRQLNMDKQTWTNTLMLKNVQMNQAGWYECRVFETGQNYGFWSTHEKLNVIGKKWGIEQQAPLRIKKDKEELRQFIITVGT